MQFATRATLVASLLFSSASAHVMLGTKIPGFGRQQGFDALLNRSPLNSFIGSDPSKVALCKNLQSGKGTPTKLNPGPNTFDLDLNQAPHGGGSMQVSLSYDGGKTFKVIKSFIAGFPRNNGGNNINPNQTYNFNIPSDAKAGSAIFQWSWSNLIGNREFYTDCAPITITGSGTNTLSSLPNVFVANIDSLNSCKNAENINVEYPNPGSQVERGAGVTGPPTGNCGGTLSAAPAPSAPVNVGSAPAPGAPAPSGTTYTVVQGDTCDDIGAAHGVSGAEIMSKNPSINSGCTNLQIGQVITLRRRSRIMI